MNLIGLSGYMQSGKTTVGEIIQGFDPEWEIKGFSHKLKQIASLLTGIPWKTFEDQGFKNSYLGKEWDFNSGTTQYKVRDFLQQLGTEAIRDVIHENAWVNALFADYKEIMNSTTSDAGYMEWGNGEYPKWVIADVRFPNEAKAIKDRGGIIVRINRHNDVLSKWEEEAKSKGTKSKGIRLQHHPSEISLDDWSFDYTINNNRTLEELVEKVREMLIKYEVIKDERNNQKEEVV